VQYSKDGTPAQNLAKQQQERLQKLISAQAPAGNAAAPATQPSQSPSPTSPRTPH